MADDTEAHERDHEQIAAAVTPSRRSWMLDMHLRVHHSHEGPSDVPPEDRALSLQALHNGIHWQATAPPAARLSVAKAVSEDLVDALAWVGAVDAESAEQAVVAAVGALLERIGGAPVTAAGGRLVRCWRRTQP